MPEKPAAVTSAADPVDFQILKSTYGVPNRFSNPLAIRNFMTPDCDDKGINPQLSHVVELPFGKLQAIE
jgi:hypothetical protein